MNHKRNNSSRGRKSGRKGELSNTQRQEKFRNLPHFISVWNFCSTIAVIGIVYIYSVTHFKIQHVVSIILRFSWIFLLKGKEKKNTLEAFFCQKRKAEFTPSIGGTHIIIIFLRHWLFHVDIPNFIDWKHLCKNNCNLFFRWPHLSVSSAPWAFSLQWLYFFFVLNLCFLQQHLPQWYFAHIECTVFLRQVIDGIKEWNVVSPEGMMEVALRNRFTLQRAFLCSQGDEYRLECGILISLKHLYKQPISMITESHPETAPSSSLYGVVPLRSGLNRLGGNLSGWAYVDANKGRQVYLGLQKLCPVLCSCVVVIVGLCSQSQMLQSWHFLVLICD